MYHLCNKKFIIFDLKYLCQKSLAIRCLAVCVNYDHCIHYSLSAGNNLGQTNFNHADIV
jgi:hypothetical protein